jgi:hypothetical protein
MGIILFQLVRLAQQVAVPWARESAASGA